MSASRLQKLLKLLESNNESTRKAASKQISDIATAHPSQLVSITRKVHALLYHSNWDTRVAAAATVGGLAEIFVHHSVRGLAAACSTPANGQQQALYQVDVPLASFDLDRVLQKGQPLLASGGQEYDIAADSSLPLPERVAKQRQMLRERLGLGKGMEGKAFDDIINTEELVNAYDLAAALTTPTAKTQSTRASRAANRQRSATPEKQQASELLRCDSMSARERNKLKRKHKALQRQDSVKADAQGRACGSQVSGSREASPSSSKLSKAGGSITPQSAAAAAAAAGAAAGTVLSDEQAAEQDEAEWQAIECGTWPFQRLADHLCNDILNPVWIVRHGAAAGLRELLREQAAAAAVEAPMLDNTSGWASPGGAGLRRLGVVLPEAVESASAANAAWLEDVIEHLLCVLALDRFADYVSDQVVVPVRETAAQALGAALQPTSLPTLQRVLELLSSMHRHHEWSVRHGAFTGIKYLLASRPEASGVLLPAALPVLLAGLTDTDDSVQAAAAEALMPMAPLLLTLGDEQTVDNLRNILWKLLSSMEQELSVATSSSLSLLAALCSPPAQFPADAALSARLPVLWPFLLHSMSSVRMAAATTLERLATIASDPAYAAAMGPEASAPGAWLKPVAGPCLRLLLQCLLTERDARVQQGLLCAWSSLLDHVQACDLAVGLTVNDLRAMLNLIATPCGHALDTSQLVIPYQGRLLPWGSDDAEEAGFTARPTKTAKSEPGTLNGSSQSLSGMSNRSCGASSGAGRLCLDPEAWAGMEDQEPAVKARLVASRAMAQLCCKLQGQEPSIIPGLLYQQMQQPGASSRIAASLVILNWLQQVAAKCRDGALAAAVKTEEAAATVVKPDTAGAAAGIKSDPEALVKTDADSAAAIQPWPATTPPAAAVRPSALSAVSLSAAICAEVPEVLPDTCLVYLGAPGASMPSPPTCQPYSELTSLYGRMRRDLYALVNASLQVGSVLTSPSGIPIEQVSSDGAIAMAAVVPPEAEVGDVAAAKAAVLQSATHVQLLEAYLHTSACIVLASAVVASGRMPAKLNTVIQNLMAGLRKEPVVALQEVAATAVAELMAGVAVRQPCPNEKLVKNLCSMVCGDPCETPSAAAAESLGQQDDVQSSQLLCQTSSVNSTQGPNSQPTATQAAPAPDPAAATARVGAECALKAMCERFGAGLFQQLPSLWLQMSGALGAAVAEDGTLTGDAQGLINALQVVTAVVPSLHPSLVPLGLQLLPQICGCLRHGNAAVRFAAARCSAALAAAQAEIVLPLLLKQVVPLLRGTSPVSSRLGAVEVMAQLVTQLQRQLVSYTVLLVVPLLRRMSDPVVAVRRKAALCFGSLTALLPLAQGLPLPEGLDADQRRSAEQDGEFLSQLLDNRKVEDYCLPLKLKVELRRYQQEGINWLSFLRRFGLNGVLADDMGLGKTLQATVIVACSVAERRAVAATALATDQHNVQQQQEPAVDNSNHVAASAAVPTQQGNSSILPSLVVCPSTLVGHWAHEINKYVDESVLKPLAISGTPSERAAAAKQLQKGGCNVVIIGYETLRSDAEWAAGVEWDYVILDEGHVIRSTKSKLAQAVKRLNAQHRLVLSGTPIQNSALELWSLFDFLMPGFLGGEREFNSCFGRVVNAARYSKKGSKEAEAGTLALDALHKQVMPFILRRTKAQVLQDLPPKIVTDVLCKLSPIQQQLYEDFSSSQALTEVTGVLKQQQQAAGGGNSSSAAGEGSTGERHVFSALLYLRKVCSHPLLALDWSVPAHRDACQEVLGADTQPAAEAALRAVEHAPKLLALQDILMQCGLVSSDQISMISGSSKGCSNAAAAAELELSEGSSDSGHRLLVFAQLKGMLDLAESCLLKPLGISTLRLDGSIDASARFSVVQRFNSDPTIQVLLLTTHVGGLGLNLTSADTVVFLEHDWNPMKDLQAMDRAHRIGQTRTVNVYRLLMQDTVEERIMSLQQFKLDVASAVVNQDNVSMSAMDTGQLLDLFAAPIAAAEEQQQQQQQVAAGVSVADAQAVADGLGAAAAGKKRSALQTMLDSMGDLWDESQYQSEFDMKGFMQKLAKKQPQQ